MHLARGSNLNAPVDGVRPDLSLANVVDVVSDAALRAHTVNFGLTFTALVHRTFLFLNYARTQSTTNTAGPFWLPAGGDDLSGEWGMDIAAPPVRWRVQHEADRQPHRRT